ncbi:MAG TPA: hypothetical protein VD905_15250 [Flavobacteriales bacterium]|nr:hypothetical protein [Flavobacteriales bacterium]
MNNSTIPGFGKRFTVVEHPGELLIKHKWERGIAFAYLIPLVLIVTLIIANYPGHITLNMRYWIPFLGCFLFYLFYYTLCYLFNTTVITCNNQMLKVYSGPMPVFDKKTILSTYIDGFYTLAAVTTERKNFFRYPVSSFRTYYYSLILYDKKSRKQNLIKLLRRQKTSLFLEQKLEKFYKLEKKPVESLF